MKSLSNFLAGLLTGALLAVLALLVFFPRNAPNFWTGVSYGFGAGFGGVVGLSLLNWLVGQLDRIKSGR